MTKGQVHTQALGVARRYGGTWLRSDRVSTDRQLSAWRADERSGGHLADRALIRGRLIRNLTRKYHGMEEADRFLQRQSSHAGVLSMQR